MRIVSLVPGVTDILAALGLGSRVVGCSHECAAPGPGTRRVTSPALDLAGLSDAAIDRAVSAAGATSSLDEAALAACAPDLVVTQDLCAVCGLTADAVRDVVDRLPGRPALLSLAPGTLAGVIASVEVVATAAGERDAGEALAAALRARVEAVRAAVAGRDPVTVACLEWVDPPYRAGHWVPDLVAAAGGVDLLGVAGEPAVPVAPEEVAAADPEVILLAPCGFAAERAARDAGPLMAALRGTRAVRGGRVHALDADALVSRPGPGLVAGVEVMAALIHPDAGLPAPPPGAHLPLAAR